jgi:hypothetical protein
MSNQRGSIVLGAIIFLVLIYFLLFFASMRGCGYAGYRHGYAYRPSFFYWGGPSYYGGPSVRTGSTGGPSPVGKGPGTGK